MPTKALKNCVIAGCTNLTKSGNYCQIHKPASPKRIKQPYEYLYNSKRWQEIRAWFLRQHPVCVGCGRAANEVDHKIPHKGNAELFFSTSNLQAMCKPCHSSKTLREINEQRKNPTVVQPTAKDRDFKDYFW